MSGSFELDGAVDLGGDNRVQWCDDDESPTGVALLWTHRYGGEGAGRNGDGWCRGTIRFPPHTLVARDPLHVEASVGCPEPDCGAHGWIRDGRWMATG